MKENKGMMFMNEKDDQAMDESIEELSDVVGKDVAVKLHKHLEEI